MPVQRKRQPSGPDWEAVKNAYLAGAKPRDLVARFGVTNDALKNRIIRGKWTKERQEVDAIAAPGRHQKIADVVVDAAERITRAHLDDLDAARAVARNLLPTVRSTADLRDWASAYKHIQACERLALGLVGKPEAQQDPDAAKPGVLVVPADSVDWRELGNDE